MGPFREQLDLTVTLTAEQAAHYGEEIRRLAPLAQWRAEAGVGPEGPVVVTYQLFLEYGGFPSRVLALARLLEDPAVCQTLTVSAGVFGTLFDAMRWRGGR